MPIDIKCLNLDKIVADLEARSQSMDATLEKTAKQMGILATNEIHPLTAKKTGNWDSTIYAKVTKLGPFKYELWVGSKGAFTNGKKNDIPGDDTPNGRNYGADQEHLNHPIEMGWNAAQAAMKDLYQRNITAGVNYSGLKTGACD